MSICDLSYSRKLGNKTGRKYVASHHRGPLHFAIVFTSSKVLKQKSPRVIPISSTIGTEMRMVEEENEEFKSPNLYPCLLSITLVAPRVADISMLVM